MDFLIEVLVVDDSIEICELIEKILSRYKELSISRATSYSSAKNILKEKSIDIIILDILLPDKSGWEICKEIRKMPEGENTYILILSALSNEKNLVKGFELGANDFLVKPFSSRELSARIKAGMRAVELIKILQTKKTLYKEKLIKEKMKNKIMIEKNEELHRSYMEIEQLNKKLKIQATIDSLTQIFNRGIIIESLKKELENSYNRNEFCIILLDADDFKKINDNFGHLIGDKVLREISKTIQNSIRNIDVLGRYGGEEFLIILPNTSINLAFEIAKRILKNISLINIKSKGKKINVTMSLGVTEFNITKKEKVDDLILRADIGLYMAKNNGKNTIFVISKNSEVLHLQ